MVSFILAALASTAFRKVARTRFRVLFVYRSRRPDDRGYVNVLSSGVPSCGTVDYRGSQLIGQLES